MVEEVVMVVVVMVDDVPLTAETTYIGTYYCSYDGEICVWFMQANQINSTEYKIQVQIQMATALCQCVLAMCVVHIAST